MILLTPELCLALRQNDMARRACDRTSARFDPLPVVKFFSPLGAATWLATELGEDGDTMFGLVDLGFGCPELGSFSLSEIASVRLPFCLGIERDIRFETISDCRSGPNGRAAPVRSCGPTRLQGEDRRSNPALPCRPDRHAPQASVPDTNGGG